MKLNYLSVKNISEKELLLPTADSIDICIFPIDAFSSIADDESSLSLLERKRASCLRQGGDKLRFMASRILLRRILSLYLSCPAERLSFSTGAHGKPALSPEETKKKSSPEIQFNLSHSGRLVALAFSTSSPLGIDIENTRRNIRAETLVRRFFHPDEYLEFLKLDSAARQDFLLRRWTVREAFLKGIGSGFSMSPASFYVEETSHPSSLFRIKKSQEDYSSWRIKPIFVPDGYYCSVAYQTPSAARIKGDSVQ